MSKHIYAEIDNLRPIIDWLKTKPEGNCIVVIGNCDDAGPTFLNKIGSDLELARWLFDKVSAGQFEFRSIRDTAEIPIGIVVTD